MVMTLALGAFLVSAREEGEWMRAEVSRLHRVQLRVLAPQCLSLLQRPALAFQTHPHPLDHHSFQTEDPPRPLPSSHPHSTLPAQLQISRSISSILRPPLDAPALVSVNCCKLEPRLRFQDLGSHLGRRIECYPASLNSSSFYLLCLWAGRR